VKSFYFLYIYGIIQSYEFIMQKCTPNREYLPHFLKFSVFYPQLMWFIHTYAALDFFLVSYFAINTAATIPTARIINATPNPDL
jgi:hypothetical protein